MLSAFVFLNCEFGSEPEIIDEMKGMSGVSETARVSGVYDIVAKVREESKENIVKLVKKIRAIANIKSSLTMIVSEEHVMKKPLEVAR